MAADQESKQKYLGRNRPPRVQITYDVEIGNAFTKEELPLVVGILSDLSGNNQPNGPEALTTRGFVDIDRDSFDTVLSRINPQQTFKVTNVLEGQTGNLSVNLSFKSFDDFSPENIVAQVDQLKDLYDKRQKLQDLLIKLDGNDELDKSLIASLTGGTAIATFQADLQKALAPPVVSVDKTPDGTATPADPAKPDGVDPNKPDVVDPNKPDAVVAPVVDTKP